MYGAAAPSDTEPRPVAFRWPSWCGPPAALVDACELRQAERLRAHDHGVCATYGPLHFLTLRKPKRDDAVGRLDISLAFDVKLGNQ
jgi:hypothetical protein